MEEQILREIYWKNAAVIDEVAGLVQSVRNQDMYRLNKQIPVLAKSLQQLLPDILSQMQLWIENGLTWTEDYLTSVLFGLEKAQTQQDYILMGDLYELQLIPILQDIQAIISGLDISLVEDGWWTGNMEVLQKKNPELVQALQEFESGSIQGQMDAYCVEATSTGFFTMALEQGGERWYLHSNRNPLEEARIWADRNYCLEKERYVLFGWGMGYHVRELLEWYWDMDLVVIESDLGVLYYSLRCGDWRDVLEKITLVWDPEWLKSDRLTSEGREILLYRPMITHIRNQRLHAVLNQIADRKDAIEDSKRLFYQNMRENIRNCTSYVDEIQNSVRGKRVVIVAGGPSLDKNLELLKEKPEDVVIFAVGTVYKLLLQKGIPLDYVILSDLWVYYQVEGIENVTVPILLLATADRRISRYYQGKTYLVCQQGYEMAEDYAKGKGYTLYSSGGSVVTLALDIAIRLKAAAIAFIGLDLAYYDTKMHASGTKRATFQGYEFQREKAWNGRELNTTKSFLHFRQWMEKRIQEPDTTMQVVDATEGGIVKQGFIPMTLKQFLHDEK